MKKYFSLFILIVIPVAFSLTGCRQKTRLVTGCYSETGKAGINVYDFNAAEGSLKMVLASDAGPNPSYICFSDKKKLIYAINEVSKFGGAEGGGLTTLKYDRNFTRIKKVNELTIPNGGPCYISITLDNRFLLIANYGGGSVTVVRLGFSGMPKKVTDFIKYDTIGEKRSHAHMISSDPQGKRIYVTDLGLDRIMIYTLNKYSGKLVPLKAEGIPLPPGTGPRHFVFNREGSEMYVNGELNSTLNVLKVDDEKGLILTQSIGSLREGFQGPNYPADVHIGKSGHYLYSSNRGENTIATFKVDNNGNLTLTGNTDCGGNWPRNFVIDPSGKYLLVGNERSGSISVFRIDGITGAPSQVTQKVDLTSPACLKFIE